MTHPIISDEWDYKILCEQYCRIKQRKCGLVEQSYVKTCYHEHKKTTGFYRIGLQ